MKIKDIIVSPQNARSNVSEESLIALTDSLKGKNLINKLTLRPGDDGKYEVVAGQRRLAALKEIHGEDYDLKEEDYVIFEKLDDKEAFIMSIQENQLRVDLSPLDLNRAILKLNQWGYKDKEITSILGITPHRMKRLSKLSMDLNKMPESVKEELSKPDSESKLNDLHWDKISGIEDPDVVKDVVDFILEHDSSPKDIPNIVKGVEKQYKKDSENSDDFENEGDPSSNSIDPIETPIEYAHKGELVLRKHGDEETLIVVTKREEEEIPIDHYLEYLRHPEKFRIQVSFKMKVKPID